MLEVVAKTRDGKEVNLQSEFDIGEYVEVVNTGCQYSSFATAFLYFWGNTDTINLPYNYCINNPKNNYYGGVWKVINIALHETPGLGLIYHIRNRNGDNCVIGPDGIKHLNFHKRNRNNKIMVYQIPKNEDEVKHDWSEKLYEIIK